QKPAQGVGDTGVIFDQQDLRSGVHAVTCGNTIPKVVPRFTWVWYWSAPPCFCTIRAAIDNPRPVPFSFVVKNGSKSLFSISGGMPFPVSVTSRIATSVSPLESRFRAWLVRI